MKKFVSFLFLFLVLSVSVFASDTDDVKKYTQNLIDDAIVKIFKTGVASNERVIPFRKVLNDNFDFDIIAKMFWVYMERKLANHNFLIL